METRRAVAALMTGRSPCSAASIMAAVSRAASADARAASAVSQESLRAFSGDIRSTCRATIDGGVPSMGG